MLSLWWKPTFHVRTRYSPKLMSPLPRPGNARLRNSYSLRSSLKPCHRCMYPERKAYRLSTRENSIFPPRTRDKVNHSLGCSDLLHSRHNLPRQQFYLRGRRNRKKLCENC